MGQKPIFVRLKQDSEQAANGYKPEAVSVGEAARRLGLSERTVFRLLKEGHLERVDDVSMSDLKVDYDRHKAGIKDEFNREEAVVNRRLIGRLSKITDLMSVNNSEDDSEGIRNQLREKDVQIAQLLKVQQEMTESIQRLQEQMYELAHLVLSHNAAAAQARAEAELRLQEQAQATTRRGLAGILSSRARK